MGVLELNKPFQADIFLFFRKWIAETEDLSVFVVSIVLQNILLDGPQPKLLERCDKV